LSTVTPRRNVARKHVNDAKVGENVISRANKNYCRFSGNRW